MLSLDWGIPCPAPAKLNLFLHVTGKRSDGYHTIQTCFRLINLYDMLTFYPRSDGQVILHSEIPGTSPAQELSVRAATLLRQSAGIRKGVDIEIKKVIPIGGGLGGGSSNAATTLLVLNRLWNINWNRATLQKMAAALGADVPFFIFGEDAFADGIGDHLQPIAIPQAWYVVLFPPVHVSTARIFSYPALERSCRPIQASEALSAENRNVLTSAAVHFFPVIQSYLDWLSQFGTAKMSGSGASVFVEFPNKESALGIYSMRPPSYHGVVVSTISKHPLYTITDNSK